MPWKPAGHSAVSPYLLVGDAEKTLTFLETVFGAERLTVHRSADGAGIAHAEARIDDSVIVLSEMAEIGRALVHVYVSDPDEAFARALDCGAEVVQPLRRAGDGDYRGGVSDGNGVQWWISQHEDRSA